MAPISSSSLLYKLSVAIPQDYLIEVYQKIGELFMEEAVEARKVSKWWSRRRSCSRGFFIGRMADLFRVGNHRRALQSVGRRARICFGRMLGSGVGSVGGCGGWGPCACTLTM